MASTTFAADQSAAARVCERAAFASDRQACLMEVRQGRYFDQNALNICSRLSFSSNYSGCIRALRDKRYQEFEIRECQRQSFDDHKVNCLRQFGQMYGGQPYPPPHYPPQPPHYPQPQPTPPHYGQPGYGYGVTGPAITRRWARAGEYKVSKLGGMRTIYVRGQYLNEISLVANKENLHLNSVLIYLVDGQVISLHQFNNRGIREGQMLRDRLDRRYSLRVDRIEINATSSLIGSRGILRVDLGIY